MPPVSMKRWGPVLGALIMAAVAMAVLPAPPQAAGSATEAVKHTIDEVIRLLKDRELQAPGKAQERRRRLEQVIGERFNYRETATRALGSHWQRLNDKEKNEFVELFQRLLAKTYAGKIEGYAGEQVSYLGERVTGEYAEVRTKIVSANAEIPLDYRLLNREGDWRAYDVVVDGVSLVSNYRGQFARMLRSASFADVLEQLRKKVGADDGAKRSTVGARDHHAARTLSPSQDHRTAGVESSGERGTRPSSLGS